MAGDLFRSFTNVVSDMVRSAVSGNNQPYSVDEINSQYLHRCTLITKEEYTGLYKDGNCYLAILHNRAMSSKYFCLFRLYSESEAMTTFSSYSHRLEPLCAISKRFCNQQLLQRACDALRENPTWSVAHVAAHVGLDECFRNDRVTSYIVTPCEASMCTPVMVAVAAEQKKCVQELIVMGVPLNMADHHGENVFHYAARASSPEIIQLLASRDISSINQLNLNGESPLHVACKSGRADNVERLLRWQADPLLTRCSCYPIHYAMKGTHIKCAEVLCRWDKSQLHLQDSKYGGTPLHWAKSPECIYKLGDLGCNMEIGNTDQETAMHIMIRRNRLNCVMALLTRGARASSIGIGGNNCLHLAVQKDNMDMVQALIVFGANVNGINNMGISVRHEAATNLGKSREEILYLLHRVGAKRCEAGMTNCRPGCTAMGSFDGKPPDGRAVLTPTSMKEAYDSIVDDLAMTAALTRSASASEPSMLNMQDAVSQKQGQVQPTGDHILCLDGGGIRGLILIQLLIAIQKAVGRPIRNCFDWIAGTSTGGILALAIVHGKSLEYCQGLYLRLKDEVFQGSRPYESEPLERFMKREFGENILMTDVEYPRVLVSAVLGDRFPAELHFFRNYDPPGVNYAKLRRHSQFEPVPRPNEQLVWVAARASGAAPTYFRSMGRFVDGGLMANNPTLDTLTEVHEYNMGLKAEGKGDLVRPLHVVVSLGTGKIPQKPVKAVDLYRPQGLFDIIKIGFAATSLGQLLVDQATLSEGRPEERSRAWCSMIDVPFFRFSPQLTEDIPLDGKENKMLMRMLWETQCYIVDNWHRFEQLAQLLRT